MSWTQSGVRRNLLYFFPNVLPSLLCGLVLFPATLKTHLSAVSHEKAPLLPLVCAEDAN